jgi:AAA-like domain
VKTAVLDFPIKHIDGNLVFSHDGTVTAYYQVSGFNYDFLDHDDKFIPFQSQTAFFYNNRYDLHLMVEPFPTDIEEIINATIEEMKYKNYELKEYGIKYMEALKKVLIEQRNTSETSEYHQYIGIQLNPEKNRYKDGNAGTNMVNYVREFFKGINQHVSKINGLHVNDIMESEIEMWRDQADTLMESIRSAFNCIIRPATTVECVYLVEKEFSVTQSNSDISVRPSFVSGEQVVGIDEEGNQQKAIRPNENAFIEVQNTNIEEITPTSLLFSKVVDKNDTVKNLYVQYLVAHSMDSENYFPSFEWLYYLQSNIPFPVSVSIRAYHQSNERITKRLSNKLLEYDDQRKEARKAKTETELSLDLSEAGAIKAEAYFKKTGQPAYACSFVFKITAETEKELMTRSRRLKDELIKYGIKIEAPYGEQLNLMMERILGSRQINNDYKIEVDCGLLAGMMFGATTNIGDNRGFYIGFTERMHRPVFIQPDLAAKSFEGLNNIEDSISAIVAGATGKGKSVFMNLFTYLSVLTGSQAVIIDPKGDRKNWDELPLIPSEYISKWTLGESKEDAGCLDPFRTSVDIEEGKSIALDILSYLTGVTIRDIEYTILSEAIEEVGKTDDPCIGAVISHLEHMYNNEKENMTPKRYSALEMLKDTLLSLKRQPLSVLLFGEVGQNYRVLKVDKPLQILMVQNLNLPDINTTNLRPSHKISEAILISITSFTKQYMFRQDRTRHKIILQDEASSIDRSPVGRELMDFIVRKGRYYNTTLLKGSQNATDHGDDVANVGMKFSFGLRTTKEASEMLEFLNLPQTRTNIDRIRSLSKGKCLFQDIYGRSAVIQIDLVFSDLAKAFDSSTSTEEERERERRRRQYFESTNEDQDTTNEHEKEGEQDQEEKEKDHEHENSNIEGEVQNG